MSDLRAVSSTTTTTTLRAQHDAPRPSDPEPTERFEQVLRRTIRPPRNPDDLDGDGRLSKGELLVRRLKDAAEQLAFELVLRRGDVDPARITQGMQRLQRLATALAERIVSKEPYDDEDLANIAMEAMSIIAEATSRPDAPARDWDEEPDLDGKVEWRHERKVFAEARGALAARLAGGSLQR